MSAKIVVYNDPAGITEAEINEVEEGSLLFDWLIDNYGCNGFDVPTSIYSGEISADNEIYLSDPDCCHYKIGINETIIIVHRPQEVATIIAIVVSVLSFVLIPEVTPPPTPENPNFPKTNESPNNRLVGQTNIARPLGRIPDLYGRMRAFPDLGARTVTEFIAHVKFVTEYLIIGRGQFDLEDIKSGETLISDIVSSDAIIYEPGDVIPELLNIEDSNEVNGQEVKAPNDTSNFETTASGVFFFAGVGFEGEDVGLAAFGALDIGMTFTISGTGLNDGTYTLANFAIESVSNEDPELEYTNYKIIVEETFLQETVAGVTTFDSGLEPTDIVGAFKVPGSTNEVWIDITCPRGLADRTASGSVNVSVEFDIILEQLSPTGAVLATEKTKLTITDNTLDARFYTFKLIPATPGDPYQVKVQRLTNTVNDSSYYDTTKWSRLAGVERLNNFDQGNVTSAVITTQATDQSTKAQERKFNVIANRKLRSYSTGTGLITGIKPIFLRNIQVLFENGSVFKINNNVDPEGSDLQSLVAGDIIKITNTTDGLNDGSYTFQSIFLDAGFVWTISVLESTFSSQISDDVGVNYLGELTATTKMADAMLEHLTDPFLGNKSDSEVDLDALYTIQDSLDSNAIYSDFLGRFSYSFSGEKSSVGDELKLIANACRCFVVKQGNSVTFNRDEIQVNALALINTYTKKPKSENKSVRLHKPNDFDGIELQWSYEDTSDPFIVNIPTTPVFNRKKIEAAGIKNFRQAWNRASIEFKKLELQRHSVETTVTKEGILFNVGDRIRNSDSTDVTTQTGQVKAVSGLNIETYDPVDFDGNPDALVTFRNESGILEENTVTPRGDSINGFVLSGATTITIRVRGELGYQVGTLYTFSLTGESKIRDYVIQSINPVDNRYAKLKMINYDSAIYAADTETPPPHETTDTNAVALDIVPSSNIVADVTTSIADSVIQVNLTALQSASSIPVDHGMVLSAIPASTLAWDLAPTGTYQQSGFLTVLTTLSIDEFGIWDVDGNGTLLMDTGSGEYRPGGLADTSNYEMRITINSDIGSGGTAGDGGIVFGTYLPITGNHGVTISNGNSDQHTVNLTLDIREIATPANILTATITLVANGTEQFQF